MKNKKFWILTMAVTIVALALVGCNTNNQGDTTVDEGDSITINHELGQTIIAKKPEKVVVFDYGILDAMDSIGEDIIGLPKQSTPAYLDKYKDEKYTDVGSLKEPNFETIYELQPDLIIISGRQQDLYEEFKKIAPTVYLSLDGGNYINSFKENMELLGQIFQKEDVLKEEVAKVEKAIEELKEIASSNDKNALFIMANDGNLSAYGEGSRFGILHKEFGLTPADPNIEVSTHGQKITFEYIVEKDPDYLFVMDRAAVAGGDLSAIQVMDNELIRDTKAYKNDNIVYLDAHVWYVSSGGITGTMKMIDEVKTAIE